MTAEIGVFLFFVIKIQQFGDKIGCLSLKKNCKKVNRIDLVIFKKLKAENRHMEKFNRRSK